MKYPTATGLVIFFLVCWFFAPDAAAQDHARTSDTLSLHIENDYFSFKNKDRHYTNGMKISWISRDLTSVRDGRFLPDWWVERFFNQVPRLSDPDRIRTVSVSLGQNIYTPENIHRTDLIVNDRPYAGVTYMGFGLHGRTSRMMDTLELGIGLVGPHSYAEDVQNRFHDWIDNARAMGWENQLHDEPIVNVFLERKWKVYDIQNQAGWGFDCIPHLGLAVGNAFTGLNVGAQVRLGWNLPYDFGTYLIRPGSDSGAPQNHENSTGVGSLRRYGFHLFFVVDGSFVARNILLDGNTFRDSHRVDKNPFVADLIGGVGFIIHRFEVTYSLVYRTKEFETQREEHQFGSIALSYSF